VTGQLIAVALLRLRRVLVPAVDAAYVASTTPQPSAAVADHRDEYSPELLADQAVDEEVDGRVEREKDIGDGVDVAVIVRMQLRAPYQRRLKNIDNHRTLVSQKRLVVWIPQHTQNICMILHVYVDFSQ